MFDLSFKALMYFRVDQSDKQKSAAEGQVSSLSEQLTTVEEKLKIQVQEKSVLQKKIVNLEST